MTIRLTHRSTGFAEAALAPPVPAGVFTDVHGEQTPLLRFHGLLLLSVAAPRALQIWIAVPEIGRWSFDESHRHGTMATRLRRFATLPHAGSIPTDPDALAALTGDLLARAAGPHVPRLLDALEAALLALLIRRGADPKAAGGLSWTIGPTLECRAKDGGRISIDLSRLRLKRRLAAFRIPAESGTRLQAPTVLRPYEGRATSAHERAAERALLLDALGPDAEILLS